MEEKKPELTSTAEPVSSPPSKKPLKLVILGCVCFLILLGVGTGAYILGTRVSQTPNQTVNNPSPTGTLSSPTPSIATNGQFTCNDLDHGYCELVGRIKNAIDNQQLSEIPENQELTEITCDPDGWLFTICEGKAKGEKVSGYEIGRYYSEGSIVAKAQYIQELTTIFKDMPSLEYRGNIKKGTEGAIVYITKVPNVQGDQTIDGMFTVYLKNNGNQWVVDRTLAGGLFESPQDDQFRNVTEEVIPNRQ